MKLYRGTTIKECEKYKKGIPVGKRFTNQVKEAKRFGDCIVSISVDKKNLIPLTSENEAHKSVNINTKYFKNKKIIKRFKIK